MFLRLNFMQTISRKLHKTTIKRQGDNKVKENKYFLRLSKNFCAEMRFKLLPLWEKFLWGGFCPPQINGKHVFSSKSSHKAVRKLGNQREKCSVTNGMSRTIESLFTSNFGSCGWHFRNICHWRQCFPCMLFNVRFRQGM